MKNTSLMYFRMLFMMVLSLMIKADIRSWFPEPYASMYCQQFDDFKNVADFLEFAAKC